MSKRSSLLLALILVLGGGSVFLILQNPPEAERANAEPPNRIVVETLRIEPETFTVKLQSYGTVRPRTNSILTSQVSGQIVFVHDGFRDGGFFEKGDVLVALEDREFSAKVKIAEASLISAKQTLFEERAKADQARADWKRLGRPGTPNDLVLRIPQVQAAEASVLSAEAEVSIAKLNLERTKIKAPFSGRVLKQSVDFGQVVSSGETFAEIYATDAVEVRLPVKNPDLPLLDLPEDRRDEGADTKTLPVFLQSDLIGPFEWEARLMRAEGAIDGTTQQLYVVAQIDQPFAPHKPPIKIGQYVSAEITGKTLDQAVVIPVSSIYQGTFVYVENAGRVQRRNVDILWENQQTALISGGLAPGDNLVLTPLGNVVSGTAVKVAAPDDSESAQGPIAQ